VQIFQVSPGQVNLVFDLRGTCGDLLE